MTYVHIIDNTSIATNPPRSAVIDGAQVVGELPEPYLNSQGWYRLDATEPAPETEDGYHAEPRYAYDSEETPTRVVQSWEIVQDPPPTPRARPSSATSPPSASARRGLSTTGSRTPCSDRPRPRR